MKYPNSGKSSSTHMGILESSANAMAGETLVLFSGIDGSTSGIEAHVRRKEKLPLECCDELTGERTAENLFREAENIQGRMWGEDALPLPTILDVTRSVDFSGSSLERHFSALESLLATVCIRPKIQPELKKHSLQNLNAPCFSSLTYVYNCLLLAPLDRRSPFLATEHYSFDLRQQETPKRDVGTSNLPHTISSHLLDLMRHQPHRQVHSTIKWRGSIIPTKRQWQKVDNSA